MLVKDLLKELKLQDPEARVMLSYDYGDYGHTQATEDIRRVDVVDLQTSGYSPSGYAVIQERDGYVPEPDIEDVVVLT